MRTYHLWTNGLMSAIATTEDAARRKISNRLGCDCGPLTIERSVEAKTLRDAKEEIATIIDEEQVEVLWRRAVAHAKEGGGEK